MNRREQKLDEYLRGNSEVSRAYRQLHSPKVPAGIDRKIAAHARQALSEGASHASSSVRRMRDLNKPVVRKPSWFAPFSLAASVLLSAAVLLAIAFDPHARIHKDDKLRLVPAVAHRELTRRQLYSSDPPHSRSLSVEGTELAPMPVGVLRKDPQQWLARIESLRRSGQARAAELELQEFRKVFPNFAQIPAPDSAR
jgi:hypothetical protein